MSVKSRTFQIGGIHPADHKLSARQPVQSLGLPETAVILVSQHIGAPPELMVQPKDRVKTGQMIAKAKGFISTNTHSSVTGTVLKIDKVLDLSGYRKDAVIIKVEPDEWADGIDPTPEMNRDLSATPDEIRSRVLEAGIVGLGGATFPSHVKLGIPPGKTADTLCINGAECEPFLTSDHRLMLEKAEAMIIGIQLSLKALGLKRALVGIEDNKKDAIAHLRKLVPGDSGIEIIPLKTWYPQGGERQLVKALVNREIPPPPKGLPIDAQCVVFNVATMFAVYEAVQKKKPLIERIVSVTGPSVQNPGNFLTRIGTPISQLLDAAGGLPQDTGKIICGGPMMGKTVFMTELPVTKGTGGILTLPEKDALRGKEANCIRCAKCVSVCPLGLEPYLIKKLSQKKMYDRAELEKITNCCECGCCHFICPSNIPLLDYIKDGKTIVNQIVRARGQ